MNNTKTNKCELCTGLSSEGSTTCLKCDKLEHKKQKTEKRFMISFKALVLFFMVEFLTIKEINNLIAIGVDLGTITTVTNIMLFATFAIIINIFATLYFAIKTSALYAVIKLKQLKRKYASNRNYSTATPIASANPSTTAQTREENRERLLDCIDDIEYYISKIRRARSTKSILTLTNEAREEIAHSKTIMKGCQAKMLKAELTVSIEFLEDTIKQVENKMYNSMHDND